MHTYEPAPRDPYQPPIPSMRPPHEGPDHARPHQQHVASATPIFDALYAEYRRSFRALPGDRSGEEDLGFTAFGHREQRGSWERSGGWSGNGRHQHANLPAALPSAPRDGRRRGLQEDRRRVGWTRRRRGLRPGAVAGAARACAAAWRLTPGRYFLRPRFSRTRTEMWIGVPSKPNSSRSRRSTKRR